MERGKGSFVSLMDFVEARQLKREEQEAKFSTRRPEAELLEALGRLFGEDLTEPRWLGNKKITNSDINPHHKRFFIPSTAIHMLTPHLCAWEKSETEPLDAPGISVTVVDPSGIPRELKLKRWSSLNQWVLIKGWEPLVAANQLQEGDDLGIWAFRHGPHHQLALLLQRIQP